MRYDFLAQEISRRDFLKKSCIFGLGLAVSPIIIDAFVRSKAHAAIGEPHGLHEAMWYRKIDETTVQCMLCPRMCMLTNGQRSFCRVREPRDGKLYTLVYELPCSVHVDPIEKKPIFHMLPGSRSLSIATAGCNLRCKYCQNWQISQSPPEDTHNRKLSCEETVRLAVDYNCRSIAYTYSEPTIFYEYMIDTAKLAKAKGIKGVYVTGGYANPEPLKELSKYIDAANVDLKGYDEEFLVKVCAETLEPVLQMLKILQTNGVWVEITNLIIPTLNDDMKTIRKMCVWIRDNLGEDTPLHFSRFWPMYRLKHLFPTPVPTLEEARNIALDVGLNYVYIGNVPGHEGNNTYCPVDEKILVHRTGFHILENNIVNGECKFCGHKIAGVWEVTPEEEIFNGKESEYGG